jgi:DNA (cytosine-5)-methyltransferase 1
VFVVASFGDLDPAAILFERQGVQGNPPPRREAREGLARPITAGSPSGSGYRNDADTAENLIAFGGNNTAGPIDVAAAVNGHGGPSGRLDFDSETFIAFTQKDHGQDASDDLAPTLRAMLGDHANAGGQVAVAFGISRDALDRSGEGAGGMAAERAGLGIDEELSPTIKAKGPNAVAFAQNSRAEVRLIGGGGEAAGAVAADVGAQQQTYVAFDARQSDVCVYGDHAAPLDTNGFSQAVAFDCKAGGTSGFAIGDTPGALRGAGHGGGHAAVAFEEPFTIASRGRDGGHNLEYRRDGVANAVLTPSGGRAGFGVGAIATQWAVRRLTPTECERLQGFPDGWTATPDSKGQIQADGARYKQLGNSMAVPVIAWIGRRILAAAAAAREA